MIIKIEKSFDYFENDINSQVLHVLPQCFHDERGYFMEVLKYNNPISLDNPPIFTNPSWIRQINRSSSSGGVMRGFHAQLSPCCQGKLVEAVTEKVYDIIVDARPNSQTFGSTLIVLLSSESHNKLWVPRGFLHGFVVPKNLKNNAVFEYICDNLYNKELEFSINPKTILPGVINTFKNMVDENKMEDKYKDLFDTINDNNLVYSEKDIKGVEYTQFMEQVKQEYDKNNTLWYKE
jgi:dTDP-4-dehydrorhamnose 3,5-epimerase